MKRRDHSFGITTFICIIVINRQSVLCAEHLQESAMVLGSHSIPASWVRKANHQSLPVQTLCHLRPNTVQQKWILCRFHIYRQEVIGKILFEVVVRSNYHISISNHIIQVVGINRRYLINFPYPDDKLYTDKSLPDKQRRHICRDGLLPVA